MCRDTTLKNMPEFAGILPELCYYYADVHGPRESYSSFPSCVTDLGKKEKAIYRL